MSRSVPFESIPARLAAHRLTFGRSFRDISRQTGISTTRLWQIEQGRNLLGMSVLTIKRLGELLGKHIVIPPAPSQPEQSSISESSTVDSKEGSLAVEKSANE